MFSFIDDWSTINFLIYIGVLLFVAKIIKEKVPFLNKIIIPSALIAGFIGLMLSDGFLGLIPMPRDAQGNVQLIKEIVYHTLAIGFIALTLKKEKVRPDKKIWSTGMIIVMTYLLQAFVGVVVVFLLFPEIFLGAGLLLPMGFGQGPGLAFSIGNGYELNESLIDLGQQLTHGAALGATIASIGFIIGGVVGVIALNYFARKRNIVVSKIHKEDSTIRESFEVETIKEIRVFDSLTTQIVIILVIYAAVYLTLSGLEYILPVVAGGLGETFAGVFHGFNFLIGILYALLVRNILNRLEKKGKNVNFVTNNFILSNISSAAFNFMITAAVLTITIEAITTYWGLVLVIAGVGGVLTFIFLYLIVNRIYKKEYQLHYFLGFFGMLTGTASTGLALLKGIDPDYESPVAEEMVLGSGTAISMALPLFALLMFPTIAATSDNGGLFIALVFIIPAVYFFVLLFVITKINKKII
jgi:ESS family glutamate:Na+ symporter